VLREWHRKANCAQRDGSCRISSILKSSNSDSSTSEVINVLEDCGLPLAPSMRSCRSGSWRRDSQRHARAGGRPAATMVDVLPATLLPTYSSRPQYYGTCGVVNEGTAKPSTRLFHRSATSMFPAASKATPSGWLRLPASGDPPIVSDSLVPCASSPSAFSRRKGRRARCTTVSAPRIALIRA